MNLTQTANLTKRFLLFFAILIVVSTAGWLGYRYYYYNVYLPSLPPPEPKADLKFGKLPTLKFIESTASATNYNYVLDTVTGDLPDKLPKIMKVFFIPQSSITLLDPDRSSNLAKSLSFNIGPQIISPTQFQFKDDKDGTLTIDLNTGNFEFKRGGNFDPETGEVGTLPSADKIEKDYRDFLSSKRLRKPQLNGGRVKVIYNHSLLKDSSTATVSIWPDDIEKTPIVTSLFDVSLVNQVLKNGQNDIDKILSMNYTYYEVDQKTVATYPIKSVSSAYAELKTGKGVTLLKTPNTSQISLRNIYLAYYQPKEYTQYLQPVFVFEGQDFAAYVPAIPNDYLEK